MAKRFRNAVGPRIRKFRVEREWTQDQLAAKLQLAGLDFDRVTVAKVESQIRSVYDFELVVVAEVLGVGAGELLPRFEQVEADLEALVAGERES